MSASATTNATAAPAPSAKVIKVKVIKASAVKAKTKTKKDDPGYVRDAQKACKGLKFFTRDRIKDKGKTHAWAYVYQSKKTRCFVNLATVGNHGKVLFRSVYAKDGKKVIASDSGKDKVREVIKVNRKKHPTVHVFYDIKYNSKDYASLDYII